MANKIDKDCISAIDSGRSGSTASTGKSLALDGTEFVLSGSGGPGIGMYVLGKTQNSVDDIIEAKGQVECNNYVPDSLLIHPYAKKYMERLPHFTAEFAVGQPNMINGLPALPGMFGHYLNLDCYASTNCDTGSCYVLSRGKVSNILGQYSPMGFFVEIVKKTLTTNKETHHNRNKASSRKRFAGNIHHDQIRSHRHKGRDSLRNLLN